MFINKFFYIILIYNFEMLLIIILLLCTIISYSELSQCLPDHIAKGITLSPEQHFALLFMSIYFYIPLSLPLPPSLSLSLGQIQVLIWNISILMWQSGADRRPVTYASYWTIVAVGWRVWLRPLGRWAWPASCGNQRTMLAMTANKFPIFFFPSFFKY